MPAKNVTKLSSLQKISSGAGHNTNSKTVFMGKYWSGMIMVIPPQAEIQELHPWSWCCCVTIEQHHCPWLFHMHCTTVKCVFVATWQMHCITLTVLLRMGPSSNEPNKCNQTSGLCRLSRQLWTTIYNKMYCKLSNELHSDYIYYLLTLLHVLSWLQVFCNQLDVTTVSTSQSQLSYLSLFSPLLLSAVISVYFAGPLLFSSTLHIRSSLHSPSLLIMSQAQLVFFPSTEPQPVLRPQGISQTHFSPMMTSWWWCYCRSLFCHFSCLLLYMEIKVCWHKQCYRD